MFKIYEAKAHLSRLVEKAMQGEDVIISKGDKPMVKLVPLSPKTRERKLGTAKGLIWMSEDFNDPLEDFKEYM